MEKGMEENLIWNLFHCQTIKCGLSQNTYKIHISLACGRQANYFMCDDKRDMVVFGGWLVILFDLLLIKVDVAIAIAIFLWLNYIICYSGVYQQY